MAFDLGDRCSCGGGENISVFPVLVDKVTQLHLSNSDSGK